MQRFSRRKGLTFEAVPTQYTRSNSYRSQFLPVILPQLGNTDVHTVAKKPKDKITIDHIFPVHCMENIRPCAKEPHCLEFTVRMI